MSIPSDLSSFPRMFDVRQDLEAVRIRLPRRITSDQRQQVAFVLVVAGLVGATSLAGCLLGPLVGLLTGIHEGLVILSPMVVVAMSVLPYVALIVGHRRLSTAGEVVLTQRTLRLVHRTIREIPLESVLRIEVHAESSRGLLRFITTEGELDLFDGLFRAELEWLGALIQHHAQRQRTALLAEGHDLDAVARPPGALVELIHHRPRS